MITSDTKIAERELRQVCFHESAHEILVHRFGGGGDVRMWSNQSPGAIVGEEKAWLGHFRMFAEPDPVYDVVVGNPPISGTKTFRARPARSRVQRRCAEGLLLLVSHRAGPPSLCIRHYF
jgi:hypothetical protein